MQLTPLSAPCILCGKEAAPFFSDSHAHYLHCQVCDLRYLHPDYRLEPNDEKAHYELHNNDINDVRYQDFVRPLYAAVCNEAPRGSAGLDYGCGTGPVLAAMLRQTGFDMTLYDPFFQSDPEPLSRSYDFIVCCEVVEHFHKPRREFERLRSMLLTNGFLGIMTHLYRSEIDFGSWYYRRDPTHVAFYSERTFEWITIEFSFDRVVTNGHTALFMV